MQVTVFGASGKIGRLVVEELLVKKHQPVVFVHRHNPFEGNTIVKIVQGDIYSSDDVKRSLQGSDAVLSALGSWGTKRKDVLSSAMRTIIPAMNDLDLHRIVSLTGADAPDISADRPAILQKLSQRLSGVFLGKIVRDGQTHISLLRASNLEWTVIRSPVMNNFGSSDYILRLKWPLPIRTIKRRAVAQSMVDQLDARDFIQSSPTIFRS